MIQARVISSLLILALLSFNVSAETSNSETVESSLFLSIAWSVLEAFLLLFLFGFIAWFIKLAFKSSQTLSILPVSNKTGESGEYDGVASGIDDILMTRLQEIQQLSNTEKPKYKWLESEEQINIRGKSHSEKAQKLDVTGGGLLLDTKQWGDISIGPVKIPLGSVLSIFLKIFGGQYVYGALLKNGSTNTIVLRLEKRRPILSFKNSKIQYFETTWPSEKIDAVDLSEGVPTALEELAYRISLAIEEEATSESWIAYKFFLKGNFAFKDYDINPSRIDRLKDAIKYYRETIHIDPRFAKAHFNLGIALDRMAEGAYDDAIYRYKKAIELNSDVIGVEAHYSLAKIYSEIFNQNDKALNELEKAEKLNSQKTYIYNLKGLIYSEWKEYQKASEYYQNAISLNQKCQNPIFYYNNCVTHYYLKNYAQAQKNGELAKKLLLEKGEDLPAPLLQTLGLIYIFQKKFTQALEYFQLGLKIEPDNKEMLDGCSEALRETGKPEEALIILQRLIRLWPEYHRGYSELACTMEKLSMDQDEINLYNNISELLKNSETITDKALLIKTFYNVMDDPKKQRVFFSVLGGILVYFHNDYETAIEYYEKLFSKQAEQSSYLLWTETLHNYGHTLFLLRDYEKAAEILEKVQQHYDENQTYDIAACCSELAKIYLELMLYSDANSAYTQASHFYEIGGYFELSYNSHIDNAECLMRWSQKEGHAIYYQKACDECNKAIRINSYNNTAYHVKGNTFYDIGDDANAIPQYEKAVEINYNLPGAHYNLGLCYLNIGQYKKAEHEFSTAIKLDEKYADPDNENKPDAYKGLYTALEKQENWNKILTIFVEIVNIYSNSSKYRILYAQALEQTHQVDKACKELKKVLKSDVQNKYQMNHVAYYRLANLYAEQGANINDAYRMVRLALKIKRDLLKSSMKNISLTQCKNLLREDVELSEIRNTLGWVLYQKNHLEESIKLLEKSLSQNMSNPVWHERLALAYEKRDSLCEKSVDHIDFMDKAKMHWNIIMTLDNNQLKNTAKTHLETISGNLQN